ncbi:hypothetical protein [Chelativorans sp. Marseille-P2723]|uniref:hypothetical protein n=1 Tax=Chelativorans sp. Marseille-P2723 TaxID=2709133 RepID=UPI00156DB9E4|nr:hypothetical protein [Chelativorans sp. Marseille-P2723]
MNSVAFSKFNHTETYAQNSRGNTARPDVLQSRYLGELVHDGRNLAKTSTEKKEINQVDAKGLRDRYNKAQADVAQLNDRKYSRERINYLNSLPPEEAFLEVSRDNVDFLYDWKAKNPNASCADKQAVERAIRAELEMQKEVRDAMATGVFARRETDKPSNCGEAPSRPSPCAVPSQQTPSSSNRQGPCVPSCGKTASNLLDRIFNSLNTFDKIRNELINLLRDLLGNISGKDSNCNGGGGNAMQGIGIPPSGCKNLGICRFNIGFY